MEGLSPDRVLRELERIAFADFSDFARLEDGALRLQDTDTLSPDQRAAICAMKDTAKGVEVKLYDKQRALELLAKYLGLFDRPEGPELLRVELGPAAEFSE